MNAKRVFLFEQTPVTVREFAENNGQMAGRQLIERGQPLKPDSAFIGSGVNMLMPGSTLPVHRHENDEEVYFFLTGTGFYIDNDGVRHKVGPGDAAFCLRGEEHGLENPGTEPLLFAAAIAR